MKLVMVSIILLLSGCASQTSEQTLYQEMGGQEKINEIVENFVTEIEYDDEILPYFEGSDIDRFIAKFSEQICALSGGPCTYSGDDMEKVHAGMNISESHFNQTVDLLINAMDKANVPHTTQNKLLAKLATMRNLMLYR